MLGTARDPNTFRLAVVLAIAIFVFRRAIFRVLMAVFAVAALALLGAGAVTLFTDLHL
jgi:hypothetical protein